MDAESRAVAERLRDALTRRGVDLPDGVLAEDADGGGCVRFCGQWWTPIDPGGGLILWPFAEDVRMVPDLDAPATWGVLLWLLAAEMERGNPPRPYFGGVAVSFAPCWEPAGRRAAVDPDTAVSAPERFRQWGATPGLALALALLAAGGEP
jgi:hypothetical protein